MTAIMFFFFEVVKKQQQHKRLITLSGTLCCYKTSNLLDQYTLKLSATLSKGRTSDKSIIFWMMNSPDWSALAVRVLRRHLSAV